MASHTLSWMIVVCLLAFLLASSGPVPARAQTDGFSEKLWNLPERARYRFDGTVHRMWIFPSDKPYNQGGSTKPRTEMQITGHDYNSGVWQFEGSLFVPFGSSGMSVMQIFGGNPTATTLMLHAYDGNLWYYNQKFVEANISNRWIRVNVIHDVDTSKLTVFINGQLKLTVNGKGGDNHFFKFGVYEQRNPTARMEARWMNVRILKKN
ncbi:hypothetical protein BRADI_4g41512v3 [Brachypodium distachyon]|uniref:Alginate lyase 2 domain-containing protein n=2 Tax=Brachypodium distachyon TaxID=15368 RepID=A0A0Q3J140_BRADI|nr:hypothetical protein BRADI_4g41512v3 [Brachypodium distachyon]